VQSFERYADVTCKVHQEKTAGSKHAYVAHREWDQHYKGEGRVLQQEEAL